MADDQIPARGPERPRVEPEIIPPGREHGTRAPEGVFVRIDDDGGVHRVFIARPGLPSIVIALVILGLVAAVIFLLLAGLLLFWIPVVVGTIVVALLAGAIRYRWWQLKGWWTRGR